MRLLGTSCSGDVSVWCEAGKQVIEKNHTLGMSVAQSGVLVGLWCVLENIVGRAGELLGLWGELGANGGHQRGFPVINCNRLV